MPAINMGGDASAANPSTGKPVIMSPFSGPEGAMLDNDQPGNKSTGAINTGIGFGPGVIVSAPANPNVKNAGFSASYVPGKTLPDGTDAEDATLLAIGGGRSGAASAGEAATVPLQTIDDEAPALFVFGNGATRDGAADGEGRDMSMVTAAGTVANGSAISAPYLNRAGKSVTVGQSSFGVNSAGGGAVIPGGLISVAAVVDNNGKEVTLSGTTKDVNDGQAVQFTLTQGTDTASDSTVVSSDAYSEIVDLTAFSAGNVSVIARTVDKFGNSITDSTTFAYAPA